MAAQLITFLSKCQYERVHYPNHSGHNIC